MSSQLVNAILLGGYYSLLAIGLAFMYSIMGIINLAHGAFIVISAYALWFLGTELGLPLPLAMLIAVAAMFVFGMALHRSVMARAAQGGELLPILATFGIAIIIDNLLFQVFGADNLSLAPLVGDLAWASFELPGGVFIGQIAVGILVASILLIAAIEALLRRTTLGRRIQATAQDGPTAGLLGVDTSRVAAVAAGIAVATCVFAGVALGLRSAWGPYSGSTLLLFAFEAVVIGGFGSLWRVLAGSMALALAQTIGAMIHPQGFLIGGHLAFLAAVFFRLRGSKFRLPKFMRGAPS